MEPDGTKSISAKKKDDESFAQDTSQQESSSREIPFPSSGGTHLNIFDNQLIRFKNVGDPSFAALAK